MSKNSALIRLENISHSYAGVPVLENINFSIAPGDRIAVTGVSGSGKTTLLRVVAGAVNPSSGRVLIDNKPLTRKQRRKFYTRTGVIFQDPATSFNPLLPLGVSVVEPLAAKLALQGKRMRLTKLLTSCEVKEKLARLCEQLLLPVSVLEKYPWQVSGGQLQRLAICRAVLKEPQLLIADEPTSALDTLTQAQFVRLLQDLTTQLGIATLTVTHNPQLVPQIADTEIRLAAGKITDIRQAVFCERN